MSDLNQEFKLRNDQKQPQIKYNQNTNQKIKIDEEISIDQYSEGDSNYDDLEQSQLYPESERQKKVRKWTIKEDENLQILVNEYGEKSWRLIGTKMMDRSPIQCLHRWTKILKPGLVKGPWSAEEDEKLLEWVKNNGPNKWSVCAENIPGRSGKQCRERWFNNLNPNVKKGNWTSEEDETIFNGYLQFGSSWSRIAKDLSGRTENSVKNRFYSTVRKLLADVEGKIVSEPSKLSIQNILRMHLDKNQTKEKKIDIEQPELILKQEILEESKSIKQEDEDDSNSLSLKRRYQKKKEGEEYSSQNLLYRKLKDQGIPVKRTSCMKDYSMFYRKYKNNKYLTKRKQKENDKLKDLKKFIEESYGTQKYSQSQASSQAQLLPIEQGGSKYDQDAIHQMEKKIMEFFNKSISEIVQQFQNQFMNTKEDDPLQNLKFLKLHQIKPPDFTLEPQTQSQPFFDIKAENSGNLKKFIQQTQIKNHIITPPQSQSHHRDSSEFSSHSVDKKNTVLDHEALKLSTTIAIKPSQPSSHQYLSYLKAEHVQEKEQNQMGFLKQLQQHLKDKDKDKQQKSNQELQVDQKMIFLLQQLNTLENMLSSTKSELSKLEASMVDTKEEVLQPPSFKINNGQKNNSSFKQRKISNHYSDYDQFIDKN